MNRRPRILAAGELLWDVFPDGAKFGGAPTNFACHAAALGAETTLFTRVGDDEFGRRALDELRSRQVDDSLIVIDDAHPTGTVNVTFDEHRQPNYRFGINEAWDHLAWSDGLQTRLQQVDAVCVGTLGRRGRSSREVIDRLLFAVSPSTLRVLDLNLRAPFYSRDLVESALAAADVLKLNDDELRQLAAWFDLTGTEVDQSAQLAARWGYRLIAVSRGAQGSLLWTPHEVHEHPGTPTTLVDPVGAGDAFWAALVLGLLAEEPLPVLHDRASRIAAYVCSQPGATPALPTNLR